MKILYIWVNHKSIIMKKKYLLLLTLTATTLSFGQVIITEIADPVDNAAARFVEIHNVGTTDFDLTGYYLGRWTNGNATPTASANVPLTSIGTLGAGQFAIIAANETAFTTAFELTPDINAGTGGSTDSNGDDQIAIFDSNDAIVDLFGVPGEDGNDPTITCHEFEDGRAERKAGITSAVSTWNEAEWNVWSDSAPASTCTSHTTISTGLDANLTNFDPGSWIGASTSSADQFNATRFSLYPNPTKSGFVNITSTKVGAIQAQVFDVLGKQVLNSILANGLLNVSSLHTGAYIVNLSQNETSSTKKLIVQ